MTIFMYKLLISIIVTFFLLFSSVLAKDLSFVSLEPSLTETMYALGAQDMLKAVSSQCNHPVQAKEKPIIGDYYFINEQLLFDIKPDYFLFGELSFFMIDKYEQFGIKPVYFKNSDIESVYQNIFVLGKLTNKDEQAKDLVLDLKNKILNAKKMNKNPEKKILYVISMHPFITIGKKSFITDIIEKSGNHSVTKNIDTSYPLISIEYAISQKPDIVLIDIHCKDESMIQDLFPNAKIIKMTQEQTDFTDRPSIRIYKSIEFFAQLGND